MLVKVRVIGRKGVRVSPVDVLRWVHDEPVEAQKVDEQIDRWDQSTRIYWCRDAGRPGCGPDGVARAA